MIITVTLNPCVHHILAYEPRPGDQVVIKPVRSFYQPGGKGLNAAQVIAGMGGEVTALTTWGELEGRLLLREIGYSGVHVKAVEVSRPTRTSTCLYNMTDHSFMELLEPGVELSVHEIDSLYQLCLDTMADSQRFALNGSSPCKAADDFFERVARAVKKTGSFVAVDTYGNSLVNAVKAAPHFIKMNLDEIRISFGQDLSDDQAIFSFAGKLRKQGMETVLITDGARGAWLFNEGRLFRIRVPEVRSLHAIGSGDAMMGAILARLDAGDSMEEACRWGAAAGAVNAARLEVCRFSTELVRDMLPAIEMKAMDLAS